MPSSIPDIAIQRLIASWRSQPAYKAAVERGEAPRNLDTTVPRQDQTRALEALLVTTYPHLFGRAEIVPFAVGIFEQILAAHREHPCMSKKRLRLFFSRQTRRRRYLEAVARGDRRVALDGTQLDPTTAEERQHAAAEIERRFGGAFTPALQEAPAKNGMKQYPGLTAYERVCA